MQPVPMASTDVHTIADIAALAGVSKSTVSRALNDSPLISAETKERIREIAREHRFQMNDPARRLSLKQSHVVALVDLRVQGRLRRARHVHARDHERGLRGPPRGRLRPARDPGRAEGHRLGAPVPRVRSSRRLRPDGGHAARDSTSARSSSERRPSSSGACRRESTSICTVGGDSLAGGKTATEYLRPPGTEPDRLSRRRGVGSRGPGPVQRLRGRVARSRPGRSTPRSSPTATSRPRRPRPRWVPCSNGPAISTRCS